MTRWDTRLASRGSLEPPAWAHLLPPAMSAAGCRDPPGARPHPKSGGRVSRMDALTLNLKQIFEPDKRYLVPMFQRPYVWDAQAQWKPLWEDVKAVAEWIGSGREPRPHFL